jgi:hypothetical protein
MTVFTVSAGRSNDATVCMTNACTWATAHSLSFWMRNRRKRSRMSTIEEVALSGGSRQIGCVHAGSLPSPRDLPRNNWAMGGENLVLVRRPNRRRPAQCHPFKEYPWASGDKRVDQRRATQSGGMQALVVDLSTKQSERPYRRRLLPEQQSVREPDCERRDL